MYIVVMQAPIIALVVSVSLWEYKDGESYVVYNRCLTIFMVLDFTVCTGCTLSTIQFLYTETGPSTQQYISVNWAAEVKGGRDSVMSVVSFTTYSPS